MRRAASNVTTMLALQLWFPGASSRQRHGDVSDAKLQSSVGRMVCARAGKENIPTKIVQFIPPARREFVAWCTRINFDRLALESSRYNLFRSSLEPLRKIFMPAKINHIEKG